MEKMTINQQTARAIKAFISQDKTRQALHHINIDKGVVYTTDGMSLCKAKIADMTTPDGVYILKAENKTDQKGVIEWLLEPVKIQFPNCERVIPARGNLADEIEQLIIDEPLNITRAVIEIFKLTGNGYNLTLIERVALFGNRWRISKAPKDGALRLDYDCVGGDTYIVVLMPFKME